MSRRPVAEANIVFSRYGTTEAHLATSGTGKYILDTHEQIS